MTTSEGTAVVDTRPSGTTVNARPGDGESLPLLPSGSGSGTGSGTGKGTGTSCSSSMTTVFSVWNTMIGSSMLSLTWAFGESGLLGGIFVVLCMGLVCWYTMSLILRRGGAGRTFGDFVDVCREVLGVPGRWAAWLGSVLILVGALAVYYILLATNAYSLVCGIAHRATGHHHHFVSSEYASLSSSYAPGAPFWTRKTSPTIVAVLFLPLLNVPSLRFYVRLSSFGIIGMLCVVADILIMALSHWQPSTVKRDLFFKPHAFFLAGIMSLAFFVHNFVLQVTRGSVAVGNITRSLRDVSIGFWLGGLSYATIGAVTYGALGNGVPQDFLDWFPDTDWLAIVGKVALLFQLCTVLPFIFALLRGQLFSAIFGQTTADKPHWALTLGYSVLMLSFAVLLATFYPRVGDVIRFTGAVCGMLYVFVLPVTVHVVLLRRENRLRWYSIVGHVIVLLVGLTVLVSQFIR